MLAHDLTSLRDNLEDMEHIHQLRVLDIIKKNNIEYTENTNGIFINMSTISSDIVQQMKDYITYVTLQQQQLDKIEQDKETIKKEFYKDNKAETTYTS